ncbi:spore germination lipoprotein GerD [Heyndrickxia ginsengihumi]|uniref:Spore gernimation protein GerD n=1 Tax=Heyndrickxia ginsengihumi TaxID=363870 RepID=A0A6M0P9D2_9BACI|nr:spore germination lipoprotein GerD [Heyndrickxia ginsengihumi]MBE6184362.1 spore gernimation protein GerD [Bacillus sp. (in: firmicutes)]MCM3025105.1 spore germination lipoprotein GerD [Heyndrickxia ginsengihumi]NEY20905.1 spore gernimation protein GerD [Heyndrickxia ginsengihumi]
MNKLLPLLLLSIIGLAACSGEATSSGQMDYNQTKKMMIDVLKTDEGKKALQDIMTDDAMKQKLVIDQDFVKKTIESTLTSKKGQEFWKTAFQDPKFTQAFAKSMESQNKDLLKKLMKDPDYQKMMIDILKDPDYEKEVLTLLKSKDFRSHIQDVIIETYNDPLFKAKLEDSLLKAAKEMNKTDNKQK